MDVAYILKTDYVGDWFELRHSLRSIEEQDWVGQVYLIGNAPPWARNVKVIRVPDPYKRAKDANIINKILVAATQEGISRKFIVNSDDQYFLRRVDITDMEPMIEVPCPIERKTPGVNNWISRVVDSIYYLKNNGYPGEILQCHVPYVVDKYKYPRLMACIPWGAGNGMWTHCYQNMTYGSFRPEPEDRTLRVKHPLQYNIIKKLLAKSTFLNHNDSGLNDDMKRFISERWERKSRWES